MAKDHTLTKIQFGPSPGILPRVMAASVAVLYEPGVHMAWPADAGATEL